MLFRRGFGKLKDLSFDKGTITIHWTGDRLTTVPLVWLRDNVEMGNRGKMMTSMKVQSLTIDERKDILVIKWLDRAADSYTSDWLESRLLTSPASLTPVSPAPLSHTEIINPLLAKDVFAESGRKLTFEKVMKHGAARVKGVKLSELMNWLFTDQGKPIKSRCGELHTEGAFLLEIPKIAIISAETPTKVKLLDSANFSSHSSISGLIPAMGMVEGSFECWGDGRRYRAKHVIFKGGKVVYSEQWRDSRVCEKEFYAVLGHFHQYLSDTKPAIDIQLEPGETVIVDNYRVMQDREPGCETATVLSLSEFQGRASAEGLEVT